MAATSGVAGSTVEKASAVIAPPFAGRVTLIVAELLSKPDGSVAVTSTWSARTVASAANAACSAAGSVEITWPVPAVAICCSAAMSARGPECSMATTSASTSASLIAVVTFSMGVELWSAPSERTSRLRCPSEPATSTPWITPS